MREEVSLGGNLNARRARRRHRSPSSRPVDPPRCTPCAGTWTPQFEAPRVHAIDDQGREVLALIDGVAHPGNPEPLPEWVFAVEHMLAAARLLRRYRNLSSVFTTALRPSAARQSGAARDYLPRRLVAVERALPDGSALVLDRDLAGPGPRIWDIANAAYSCESLISTAVVIPDLDERASRIRLSCGAYLPIGPV